ncbi:MULTISPECIES: hypothetical protein [Streptomyces]|uniref:Uncharacterized protein n=1 Tax=Streptomyces tsukubensis (strain DSM 42081 / NBRC 108919 / NRRL 18488 / 9993) TaxID=1114943 RepID=I2MXH9_STRT9|nr:MULTISPECIES: hypothetical protein [Streptomyces]AZK93857.1 hypothetical protein B7R87_08180 [Streptomyces tsukubensis]EIF89476.1 hypothetical protein [Streptomyces tsukubensis NRRL18488]MYS65261.1 hypothetical protein [Streptomyces sp. SID5473]QKM70012.1 hypothetical protein STSU_025640 [Streptomyces tsukubensis NRRL18488]TAI46009.1 hypothetical protein EWI31_02530 [Streptomyces tsukubensis]
MRRLATVLAVLAAAATLAVAVPQSASPAFAATGELIVNGTVHLNPSGCYGSDRRPLFVDNRTDSYVFVHESADCTGRVIGIVRPDVRSSWPLGRAVSVQ